MIIVGAEGFNGQVKVFIRGKYECIFCDQEDLDRNSEVENFAVCNIRGIPGSSKDCVIWAKFFLDDLLSIKQQTMRERQKFKQKSDIEEFWKSFFDKTFTNDKDPAIIAESNKIRKLNFESAVKNIESLEEEEKNIDSLNIYDGIQTISYYAKKFVEGLEYLFEFQQNVGNHIFLETDATRSSLYKDNEIFIDFLTACTNLRIFIYKSVQPKLSYQTEFQVKSIAGKIIPSIASTNSIIAAIQVTEAIKILISENLQKIDFNVKWVSQGNGDNIYPTKPGKCNENCSQ